jgi:hypoxanthine phosphoribosyltransferase
VNEGRPQTLISAAAIARRVTALGLSIAAQHRGGPPPVLLALLDGAALFAADLARAVPIPDLRLAFARASSYRAGMVSSGQVELSSLPAVVDQPVWLVDDILDTGRTLAAAVAATRAAGASQVRTCVLLDKPARRAPDGLPTADLTGFTIPDHFVVGYGLDFAGRYRHLPEVAILTGAD